MKVRSARWSRASVADWKAPGWPSAIRAHPVNEVVGNILSLLPVLMLGFDASLVAPFGVLAGFYAVLVHADLDWDFGPFRHVIASPVFHRWHHSKDSEVWDKNFAALFPFWDVLFGTFYLPRGKRPGNSGIHARMPESLWGQLAHPFRKESSQANAPAISTPGNTRRTEGPIRRTSGAGMFIEE